MNRTPPNHYDTPATRCAGVVTMLILHGAAAFALWQVESVRVAVSEAGPLFVSFLTPERPTVEPPPPPPPPRPVPKRAPPLVVSEAPAPEAAPFVAPAPEPAPVEPAVVPEPAAPAEPAPPAPAAPAPKIITNVEFLRRPQVEYPASSRRLGEQGRVVVRVLVNREGRAERVEVHSSSGSKRLDEAAVKAAREALYRPYQENGEAIPVWALVPTLFELS